MDRSSQPGGSAKPPEDLLVDPVIQFVPAMSFRNEVGAICRPVCLAGKPENMVPAAAQDLCPFIGFQRTTVGPRQPGGNKADVDTHGSIFFPDCNKVLFSSTQLNVLRQPISLSDHLCCRHYQRGFAWPIDTKAHQVFCTGFHCPGPGSRQNEKAWYGRYA